MSQVIDLEAVLLINDEEKTSVPVSAMEPKKLFEIKLSGVSFAH